MIERNGKKYARVSEIIAPLSDFGGIDAGVLARKAALGTEVHEAIARDCNGLKAHVWGDPAYYFDSYLAWKNRLQPRFVQSEERYFDEELRVTGCIDALVILDNEELPFLLDYKCAAAESRTWIYQAHLYAMLLEGAGIAIQPRYLFLQLNKLGKLPTCFSYDFTPSIQKTCLQLVEDFWKVN